MKVIKVSPHVASELRARCDGLECIGILKIVSTNVQYSATKTDPMIPAELPERPWQKVGCDLFHLSDSNYMLDVDNFSR